MLRETELTWRQMNKIVILDNVKCNEKYENGNYFWSDMHGGPYLLLIRYLNSLSVEICVCNHYVAFQKL